MQAKILKLLPNLQEQRGSGIFFITPGIALGRKVNGRIAIMLDGKIIEEGPSNRNVAAYYGFRLNINSKVLSIVQYRPPYVYHLVNQINKPVPTSPTLAPK